MQAAVMLHGRVELHVCGPPEADESHGFGSRQLTLLDLERCMVFVVHNFLCTFFASVIGRVFRVVSENL